MSVRYIFSTSGSYVAFVQNQKLFGPDSKWLGFFMNGNELYATSGEFIGYLTDDDRIVRRINEQPRIPRTPPVPPIPPLPPLPPLPRLTMPPLPYPYEDVFEVGVITSEGLVEDPELSKYDYLEGAKIMAADETYLGTVSTNRYASDSISNQYGNYGSRYSKLSIMNQYGRYGSKYSPLSPFNPYSTSPPRLIKQGRLLGYLTVNHNIQGRIDADEFLLWLASK